LDLGIWHVQLFKKLIFQGNLGYHGVDERIRLQEQKLWGIFSGGEVPKTFVGLRWPRLEQNLGSYKVSW
jgi:hypothetical protein